MAAFVSRVARPANGWNRRNSVARMARGEGPLATRPCRSRHRPRRSGFGELGDPGRRDPSDGEQKSAPRSPGAAPTLTCDNHPLVRGGVQPRSVGGDCPWGAPLAGVKVRHGDRRATPCRVLDLHPITAPVLCAQRLRLGRGKRPRSWSRQHPVVSGSSHRGVDASSRCVRDGSLFVREWASAQRVTVCAFAST